MSSLAAVLAGEEEPSVESLEADPSAQAEAAGWRAVHLDTGGLREKRSVLAAFGPALDFPEWYGANLDALVDCLRDLSGPTVLVWAGAADLREADPAAYDAVIDVLRSRTTAQPPFHVVLLER